MSWRNLLKQKARTAVLWSGAEIFLRQGFQFGISIALARLLDPEEFGTIALLYLFTGIASAFIDSGFSSALIQRRDITHTDESTVFWFNLLMGAIVTISLLAIAPIISKFYASPILIPLMAVMSLNIFISAFGSIHGTLIAKRLDFRTLMKVSAIATTVSGTAAVLMAVNNFGVWALAAQILISSSITTVILWSLNKWRPSLIFSIDSVRRLFSFGGYMMASSLLNIIYGRAYSLIIGKFYSVSDLAFYNRAESTVGLPVGVLGSILSRVSFPIFSEASAEKNNLYMGVRFAVKSIMFINAPIMLGLAATAELVVETLFGPKWLPSVPVMQILCIGGIFWPLHVINLDILKAQGYSNLFFRLEIIKITFGVLLLILGSLFGLLGIAWSTVVLNAFSFLINSYFSKKHLNYGALSQIKDSFPAVACSLLMAIIVRLAYLKLPRYDNLQLIYLVILGTIVTCILSMAFQKNEIKAMIGFIRK